ncbi:MAG: response regulator [Lachnospiraceae bacterium]|nr:response regulator [Lachnospiraceae bacterium]
MLKVFLVEDEIIMRKGIKNNIDWEREGFAFVGEASDGELAYPLIQQTRPDILLTDIRMPFMDGLELSRLVKQELPDIKIIILSGYDEFEYAKEAINIGITDYLVKPVSGAQLLEAVKKVEKVILEEMEQRKFLETFERERQENAQLARQKFFRRLVSGKQPVSVLLKEGREAGMDLAAKQYNIVLFQLFFGGEVEGYSEEQNTAVRAIEAMTEKMPEVLMVELGLEGWAFILKETEHTRLERLEQEFLERLEQAVCKESSGIEYFGGVGQAVGRLSELSRSFEEANRAFAYRYIKARNQIIRSGAPVETPAQDEELKLSALRVDKMDRRILERFLKAGLKSEVIHFLDEYLASLGEHNVQSLLFRQYVTMDLYFGAASMLEQQGYEAGILAERCGDFQTMPAVFSTIENSREYMGRVLETAIDLREQSARQKYSTLLKDARGYIEQHYDQENISLNTVAASVNLSPNHFSTIFSQETGQTFIEFLTQVRMEKAKEMLRSTSLKTAEIAFAVGYKDPHYFSYLFKKTQECTPREFRTQA